jgi:hypothetical protein
MNNFITNDSLIKRNHDWYELQKVNQKWDLLEIDKFVFNKIPNNFSVNVKYAHSSLKNLYNNLDKNNDFYIISDLSISKFPLENIIKIIKKLYNLSNFGVYVSLLSYYITPKKNLSDLPDSYEESLKIYFEEKFSFANKIENYSVVSDNPLNLLKNNHLIEGANFIFVHPNIRYFLWK